MLAMAGSGLVDLMIGLSRPDEIMNNNLGTLIKIIWCSLWGSFKWNSWKLCTWLSVTKWYWDCSRLYWVVTKLPVYCNFGNLWKPRMRNRLVSRLNDDKICNRLLSEGARLTEKNLLKCLFLRMFKITMLQNVLLLRVIAYTELLNTPITIVALEQGQNKKWDVTGA